GRLALFLCLVSTLGIWAVTRIRGDILDHEIFWLSGIGAMNLGVIAAAAVALLPPWPALARRPERSAAIACALVLAAAAWLGVNHLKSLTSFELRRNPRPVVLAAYQALRAYRDANGVERPLIEMSGSSWSEAAGVVLRLRQDGIPVAVSASAVPLFTGTFAPTGREDALVSFGPLERHRELASRPSNAILLERSLLYVDAIRIAPSAPR
nr:hypothetical protein [Acidobacteriota bacterium]